ncbi:MAG: hypothetical protein ACK5N0_08205 [Synechococcaceae cyanobacterium]
MEGHSLHPHSMGERLRAVGAGQHPEAAVLGCADSRVPVELLFDCPCHTLISATNLVCSSVLLTDRLRAGLVEVVAGYYDLHRCPIDWLGPVRPISYPEAQ